VAAFALGVAVGIAARGFEADFRRLWVAMQLALWLALDGAARQSAGEWARPMAERSRPA